MALPYAVLAAVALYTGTCSGAGSALLPEDVPGKLIIENTLRNKTGPTVVYELEAIGPDWPPLPYYVADLVIPVEPTRPKKGDSSTLPGANGARPDKNDTNVGYNCQQYPDYFSVINRQLDIEHPLNVTCWTTSPAADKKVSCEEGGLAWFKTAEGCYVPDYIVETKLKVRQQGKRSQSVELVDMLRYCPQPMHQVGAFRKQYERTYCYGCPNLECETKPLGPQNGSVELECWKTGQGVRGDDVWWKWRSADCYVPNQVFDQFAFLGNAGECHS